MKQPELGIRLTALRKEQNLTQEELVAKTNVSVRTIQRIEAGEVMPRMYTVKIILEALGENYQSLQLNAQVMEEPKKQMPSTSPNTLLIAMLAGAVYLISEIILAAMDIAWISSEGQWQPRTGAIYILLTCVMIVSYIFLMRGFIALSILFENSLLRVAAYMLIVAVTAIGLLDISSLSVDDIETLWLPYAAAAIMFGTLSIVFGVALIRLQDGMGEMSRLAGLLEIVMGCLFVTVILFFLAYIVLVPALVVELLLLYRGYEYLSRPPVPTTI